MLATYKKCSCDVENARVPRKTESRNEFQALRGDVRSDVFFRSSKSNAPIGGSRARHRAQLVGTSGLERLSP